MPSFHTGNVANGLLVLPVKANTYKPNATNSCEFYVTNFKQEIDLFNFPDELLNVLCKQEPNERSFYKATAKAIEKTTDCVLVTITIRNGRTIRSVFDLVVALSDELRQFSVNGFNDWLAADEQVEELFRLLPGQTNQENKDDENVWELLDEGYAEYANDEMAAEAEKARQIKRLQEIKDKFGGMEKLSETELKKLTVTVEETFGDEVNIKQNPSGWLTVVLPAIELAQDIHAQPQESLPTPIKIIMGIVTSPKVHDFFHYVSKCANSSTLSRMADVISNPVVQDRALDGVAVIGMVFHFHRTYKSFRVIFQSWNVLEKEQKAFRDVIGPKIPVIHKKLELIEENLTIICETLAKPRTLWDGVLECLNSLIDMFSDLETTVMSVTCSLDNCIKVLRAEEDRVKNMRNANSLALAAGLLTWAYNWYYGKSTSFLTKAVIVTSAVGSATLLALSWRAHDAVSAALEGQVQVRTNLKELREFSNDWKNRSDQVKLHFVTNRINDNVRETLSMLFNEMRDNVGRMDVVLKGILEGDSGDGKLSN
ncbi:hypothetical protein BC938DRAFT_471704 [Jimgerdemannia flammicorona]|uniref:Uncharacterized protein n=1 Tax=Jimgerdemannia flammicorona TaxID=994334 RepID=A0A433QZZ8_9FUNG|nr:hypothetical protein BC938DRAFT_471704 [Jimgerdemannia flammicorona]